MPSTKPQRRRLPVLPLLLGAGTLAVAVAVAGQQALAAQLGAWLAEVWVSTMAALLSILGAFLGG
jgi:hypothetical protein